ncbi:hypothetical protein OIHEL45_20791, partial [Sulfitobacter indolifex HEL-45]
MLTKTLSAVTADTMKACGVTASLDVSGGMAVISPVTGEIVATLADTASRMPRRHRQGQRRVPHLA